MSENTWFGLVTALAIFSFLMLVLGIPLAITYFINKKEIREDQKKRQIAEINQAIPFADLSEAKSYSLSKIIKIILGYGTYFVCVVPILVFFLGKIHYGPNIPYLVFLVVTGIPWLACFVQSLVGAENQRLRLKASNFFSNSSTVFIDGRMLSPAILLILIAVVLKISNHVLH